LGVSLLQSAADLPGTAPFVLTSFYFHDVTSVTCTQPWQPVVYCYITQ